MDTQPCEHGYTFWSGSITSNEYFLFSTEKKQKYDPLSLHCSKYLGFGISFYPTDSLHSSPTGLQMLVIILSLSVSLFNSAVYHNTKASLRYHYQRPAAKKDFDHQDNVWLFKTFQQIIFTDVQSQTNVGSDGQMGSCWNNFETIFLVIIIK